MSELLQQFHFLRPWCLSALVVLPLLLGFGLRRRSAPTTLARLVDAELLPHLLRGRQPNRWLPLGLLALGWLLGTLAFAGPSWNRVEQPLYASRAAQVIAISLAQDMLSRDVAPSRLDRARYKAHELLSSNRDGLNALIGYAGEAFVVAPLTSDAGSLSDLLNAMRPDTMPVDGNDAALAIQRGAALMHDANVSGGSLVVITDQADAAAEAAARVAAAAGVRVSVLGVGTAQGGPVPQPGGEFLRDAQGGVALARRDDASLAALAAAGGGVYVPMTVDQRDIGTLQAQLRAGRAVVARGQTGDEWQDRGPWLLLPLLLIVALGFRRGWLLLLPLLVLPMLPSRAEAMDWHGLWQRPDQRAAQALRQGGAVKQVQPFAHNPAWRAAADYRAGNYAAAAKTLLTVAGTNATYNRGNALAKQGQYTDAIKAYELALKQDPANADAVANRKAVEDWLKQQKPAPDKQPDKSPGKGSAPPKPDPSNAKDQQAKGDGKSPSKPADPGKSDPGKGDPGKGDPGKGEPGKSDSSAEPTKPDGKPSADPAKPGQGESKSGQDSKAPPANSDAAKEPSGTQPAPLTQQQQAAQKASADKAQQALQKQLDQALGKSPEASQQKSPPTHQLGAMSSDDVQSKLPNDLRQALQRVPDDPGALLRRKFQLEYLQRHGGAPDEEAQP